MSISWTIRRAESRGRTLLGWLDSRHTFSFGEYLDRDHVGFRSLRVINDDRVEKGGGFPPHSHRDMEIFSYVVSGALRHEDSMGNARTLRPGEIQLMSAGTGVTHAEMNPSATDPVRFLQVWILPEERRLTPRYTEWKPSPSAQAAAKALVISRDGRDGSAVIRQDADVHLLRLRPGDRADHALRAGRGAWIQVVDGTLELAGVELHAGDGASTEAAGLLAIAAPTGADALLFDLG